MLRKANNNTMKKNLFIKFSVLALFLFSLFISQFFDFHKLKDQLGYDIYTIALHPCEYQNEKNIFCTNPNEIQFTIMFVKKMGE